MMDEDCSCRRCQAAQELEQGEAELQLGGGSHRHRVLQARRVRFLRRYCRATHCGFFTRLIVTILVLLLSAYFIWNTYMLSVVADKGTIGSESRPTLSVTSATTKPSRVRREETEQEPAWILDLKELGEDMYDLMDLEAIEVMNAVDLATAEDFYQGNLTRSKRSYRLAKTASLKMPFHRGKALHFRQIGQLAGTASVAHIVFLVNLTNILDHGRQHCSFEKHMRLFSKRGVEVNNLDEAETEEDKRIVMYRDRMMELFKLRCDGIQSEMEARRDLWFAEYDRDKMDFLSPKINRTGKNSVVNLETMANQYDNVMKDEDIPVRTRRAVLARLDLPTWVVDRHRADLPDNSHRQKRQIVMGVLALIGVVSAVSTFYNAEQLHSIGTSTEKKNIAVMQNHEGRISVDQKAVTILNQTVNLIAAHLDELGLRVQHTEKMLSLSLAMDTAMDQMHRIIRGLNSLADRRLSPDLVQAEDLSLTVERLRRQLSKTGYELGIGPVQSIFSCECSTLIFQNGSMLVVTHIPALKSGTKMDLYELVSLPVMLESDHYSPLKNSVEGAEVYLKPQPNKNIIAVQPETNMARALTRDDLAKCEDMNSVFFCPELNVYHRDDEQECVVGLYTKNSDIIRDHCPWTVHPAQDAAVQLDSNHFVIYHHETKDVQLKCGKAVRTKSVRGLYEFYVPPGCTLTCDKFVIHGQMDFAITAPTVVSHPWAIDQMEFTEDFPFKSFAKAISKRTAGVGSAKGVTIKDLSKEYSEDEFDSAYTWGSTSFMALLAVALFILILVLAIKGRKTTLSFPGAGTDTVKFSDLQAKEIARQKEELQQEHDALRAAKGHQQEREASLRREQQHLLEQEQKLSDKLARAKKKELNISVTSKTAHTEDDD